MKIRPNNLKPQVGRIYSFPNTYHTCKIIGINELENVLEYEVMLANGQRDYAGTKFLSEHINQTITGEIVYENSAK